jgi:hypothetical protein
MRGFKIQRVSASAIQLGKPTVFFISGEKRSNGHIYPTEIKIM